MKRKLSAIFIALFLLIVLVPSTGILLWGPSEAAANEVLSAKPKLINRDKSMNGDVLSDAADWFNDHFALRQEFVTLWAGVQKNILGATTSSNVIIGENDWLYYEATLEDYIGTNPMTEREMFCAETVLEQMNAYLQEQGVQFCFAIAPNKNSLYPENMPGYTLSNQISNAALLMSKLKEAGVPTADLFQAFQENDSVLYFATDSHWNGRGAALAADAILDTLGRNTDYYYGDFAMGSHKGDLYEMLYPAGTREEEDFISQGLVYAVTSKSDDPDSITLTTQGNGQGKLLCYRDSFGRNLFPYLADSFAEAIFSRQNVYNLAGVQSGDTVIVELVERNLRYLTVNAPVFPSAVCRVEAELTALPCETKQSDCDFEGYMQIQGTFENALPNADTMVYIVADGITYETTPQVNGFSAVIPQTEFYVVFYA